MTGTPTGSAAEHAQTRLDVLRSDPAWAAKLLGGDAAATQEFHELGRKALGMDAEPSPPAPSSAQGRLDAFTNDPTIGAKLLAGDVDANRRFKELTEAVANSDGNDRLVEIIKGANPTTPDFEFTMNGSLPTRDMVLATSWLRGAGLSDGAILEAMTGVDGRTGKPFGREDVARTKALKAACLGDPAWVARRNANAYQERWQHLLMDIIINGAAV